MSLGVKESTNRVTIGVSDSAAEASVREFLRDLRVPEEAVTFQLEGPLVLDSYTLRYAQPDSLIQGGWEISNGTQACTLGFPARRTTDGAEVFVTNSHCTSAPFQSDQGSIWQPFGGGGILIGQETLRPQQYMRDQLSSFGRRSHHAQRHVRCRLCTYRTDGRLCIL